MHQRKGGRIENNLVEFNGLNIQFDHGVYASGDGLTIDGNVVRHNASYGLHLYSKIQNSVIANNLVYDQVRRRGIIVACPEGGGKNRIVHNTVVERQPLEIWNGDGEVVANNIFIAEGGRVFSFNRQTGHVLFDHNLCIPKSDPEDPHGLSEDPLFLDRGRGVFWLRSGSPAIGKGSPNYATARDFWARPRPLGKPVDLGALPFVPALVTKGPPAEWPYSPHGERHWPHDFWSALPAATREK
jgi:hypothetical protein